MVRILALLSFAFATPRSNALSARSNPEDSGVAAALEPASRRVAWFHAPKCGSSFGATLLHFANDSLPREEGPQLLAAWHPFFKKYPINTWFNGTFWKPPYDHHRVTQEVYESYKGDFAGLFRQPEQRIISSWFDKTGAKGSLAKYAEMAAGTMVRELAGQEDGDKRACWPATESSRAACGGRGALPNELPETPDVSTALERLAQGFKFVGLLEQYDLSVCLFHAMLGSRCLPAEFAHMRRTGPQTTGGTVRLHDTVKLEGFKDSYDGQLYAAAEARFWSDVKKYGVDRVSCKSICPSVAGVFDIPADLPTVAASPPPAQKKPSPKPGGWHARKDKKQLKFALVDSTAEFAYDWPGRMVLATADDE